MKTTIIIYLIQLFSIGSQIDNPVKWSYGAKIISSNEAIVFLKADIQPGWHIYSSNQKPGGPLKTSIEFTPATDYQLQGKLNEPKPYTIHDDVFDMDVSYFQKSVIFQQKIRLNATQATIKGKIKYMVCSGEKCVTPDDVDFSVFIK